MQLFTYGEIRAKALLHGVPGNKVHSGMWAILNGYIKARKQIRKKVYTMYYALQVSDYQSVQIPIYKYK